MTVKKKAPAKKKQPVKAAKKAPAPQVKKRPKKRAKKFTEPLIKIEHGEHDKSMKGTHDPVILGDLEWRDKVGNRRSNAMPWLIVKCNRPDCPYLVIVEQFSLAKFLSEKAAL
jgi:hypothetical protein